MNKIYKIMFLCSFAAITCIHLSYAGPKSPTSPKKVSRAIGSVINNTRCDFTEVEFVHGEHVAIKIPGGKNASIGKFLGLIDHCLCRIQTSKNTGRCEEIDIENVGTFF